MKTMFNTRRKHYMGRLGTFLITIALIAGMVGCGEVTPPAPYSLTMAVAPAGGGTATDLTDASPYTAGTAVSMEAVPNSGYRFISWTAPAGGFTDADTPQTTFTMPAQAVTVTANFSPFAGGSGTEGDPYRIADWYQLHNARNYRDSNFILVNDLNSSTAGYTERASQTANDGKGWQPIGGIEIIDPGTIEFELIDPFTGEFDGCGYEIRDLFINRPDEDAVALFGSVAGGVIEDVKVLDADIIGSMAVGILIGGNLGSVSSSCCSGSIGGYAGVGGLMGGNFGNVSDSHSSASVNGANNATGGLMGLNLGNVGQSYADGNVSGNHQVGGLVGWNTGIVSNSYATGGVTGTNNVGGLAGENHGGDVSYSYATGSVAGSTNVGGLVGENAGTANNSFWDTETSGQATSAGGTGKTTAEMKSIATFSGLGWNIATVANPGMRNTSYIWNIVDGQTYPFLSWES